MNSKIFETSSRKLENFLFAHDIQHVSFYKNELDGLTVWQYAVDDYFVHVLREYKIVLSRKIYMQFYDTKHHNKPHIHVYYGDFEASVGIDGELMAGSLPRKQLVFIQAWLALHEEEAYAAWNKAVQGEHFEKIAPLA